MASIEDRIVQMQFDNTAFERKMSTTIQSLDKLNTTIANMGARNGLTNVADSVRGFHFGPLSASIDGISAKFLALSTIAITALSSIVMKAIDAGAQITKALSLDPIIGGFREYELQIGSIQTILANTSREGTTLTQVNDALDELNRYSDQTIYNFGEMTRNIGTFTAAGVDLDTSVMSIKGIANLAAISGSSSQQASTAMYQLSQAIANGKVNLMDWNSVVNAGMGGEVFQRALFETGKMMGNIEGVDMSTTFDEWTASGNSFRSSLQDGWLTADVLTTTLQGFTGEMTEAQLTAIGYTQEQAQEIMRLGSMGVDAATKVRTLTQMISTTKEALQSGWSQSFRLIFGDFEEATELWTGVSEAVGGFVKRSADARNAMLQDWSDLGGRTKLIEGVRDAFKSLGMIFRPIKQAFREIFPRMTGQRLFEITSRFAGLMKAIYPGPKTVENLKRIFTGFFSALKIGWTVIKEGIKFVGSLFKSLTGAGSGNFLEFLADIGDVFTRLGQNLVGGGGIAAFFDNLGAKAKELVGFLKGLAKPISDFIGELGSKGLKAASGLIESITGSFGGLSLAVPKVGGAWEPIKNMFQGVGSVLENAWEGIKDFFGGFGDAIGDLFGDIDWGRVLAFLNTGLLGGILLLLRNFLKGGGIFGGISGLIGNISGAFGQLTGVLSAMQTSLQASALLKIAAAIGILAVSLLILSTIEPEKMSDALASLALGFGQLIGAFALLNKMGSGVGSAASMNLVATSLILIAGAVIVLVGAIKLMSMMSWEELGRGLAGVAGGLALLVGAALLLSKVKGGLIRVGLGLMAIAIALGIMAGAVFLFSTMDWAEMGKGLAGVAGSLIAIAAGMQLMPRGLLLQGAGLILIAGALNIIALAMAQMAKLSWEEMGKGLAGVAASLIGIGAATKLMGPGLPLVGLGLLAVAGSLLIIASVMQDLSLMSWEGIGKGVAGIAGALLAIGAAMALTGGNAFSALGILAMSFALTILIGVMQTMAAMSWGTIIKGVGGIALALGVLGLAAMLLTPTIVPLLGLGAAILLLGAGFALFGVGIMSVAKGLEIVANVGGEAIEVLVDAIKAVGEELPEFLESVAQSVLRFIEEILEGMPDIIEALGSVIMSLLEELETLIPKAGEVIRLLLQELLATLREIYPDLVTTGFEMLMSLLTGIRDNIGEIVTVVADIITGFMDALALKVPELIDSFYNLLIAVFKGVAAKLVDIGEIFAPKAMELIRGLINGFNENKGKIADFFQALPGNIIGWIGDLLGTLFDRGRHLVNGLWNGIWDFMFGTVVPWLKDLPNKIKNWIGDLLGLLKTRGRALINGLWNGIMEFWRGDLLPWLKDLPNKIKTAVTNLLSTLKAYGQNLISGLYNGAIAGWNAVKSWFIGMAQRLRTAIGSLLTTLKDIGTNAIKGLYNGAIAGWNAIKSWFSGMGQRLRTAIGSLLTTLKDIGTNAINGIYNGAIAGWNAIKSWFGGMGQRVRSAIGGLRGLLEDIGGNIMRSLKNGAANVFGEVRDWFVNRGREIRDAVLNFFGIGSPSKVFMWIGEMTMEGLRVGLEDEWDRVAKWLNQLNPADNMQKNLAQRMNEVVAKMAEELGSVDEFNPTITPVLDLTQIRLGSTELARLLTANASYLQASGISLSTRDALRQMHTETPEVAREVRFEQNIFAPKQLSTGDIYRQTRNQITLAKEKLSIP